MAKLSFKEAVRRRVVWVFFIFLLVFLFPASWFSSKGVKPEDMLKTTIVRHLSNDDGADDICGLSSVGIQHSDRREKPDDPHDRDQAGRAVRDCFGRFFGYVSL